MPNFDPSDAVEKIEVGMGDFRIARGSAVLVTCNLGSCVGVSIYDAASRIGALLHIKLPEDQKFPAGLEAFDFQPVRREKLTAYADTSIPIALYELEKEGAIPGKLEAKMAGGSRMFPLQISQLDIGKTNIETARRMLKRHGIPLSGEDSGGTHGRTMEFDLRTGLVKVISSEKGIRVL